jgi:hypothetical protein
MPQLTKVLTTDDLQRRTPVQALDLSLYLDLLQTVLGEGVGATLTLGPEEQQHTEKRRLTLAAKELGYQLVWRKAPANQLRLVLAKPGERAPGGRRRRPLAERDAEQLTIDAVMTDAVMTEDVAEVTATAAPTENSTPTPATRSRGRRRSS